MKLVVDLTGVQSQSRFRGIGRYTQGLIGGLARTAGPNEVWLAGSENLSEGLEAARTAFEGLIPGERIVSYQVLDQVEGGLAGHRWRRSASELIREHFLECMGADAILFSSMFEGFNDDVITSSGELCGSSLRSVIAYDLIPLLNARHYLSYPAIKGWYYKKLAAFHACDLFLAISQSAADEVVQGLGVDKKRVVAIMGGADEFVASLASTRDEDIDLSRRFGLTRPFFVYAATFEKRKNFQNLIAAFGRFTARAGSSHQLALVTSDAPFAVNATRDWASAAGLDGADIVITGQISDSELRALYRSSVALVYPSLHEGFGLPVLEAMHLDAAVIGSNVSSIPEIIGLDDAMFDPTSIDDIAEKMIRVALDEEFRRRLKHNAIVRRDQFSWDKTASTAWRALESACADRRIGSTGPATRTSRYDALISGLKQLPEEDLKPTLDDRRALANAIARNVEIIGLLPLGHGTGSKVVWRIEDPTDSSDEIIAINQEIARALSALGEDVSSRSDAFGECPPEGAIVVSSANPPQLHGLDGLCNVAIVSTWPHSRMPSEWVDQYNFHADGIACPSTYVKRALQDNGVMTPLAVMGQGVDHWDRVGAAESRRFPGKAFRFLHLSSDCSRTGADVLLAAYGDAFRRADDVSLLIKASDRPDDPIRCLLDAARAADAQFPDVVLLLEPLSDPELKALHRHCHVLVAPSRIEGFGQELAQAIRSGLPVITTRWGGHLDFCDEQTAWLVDFSFVPARGESDLAGAVWAEPDVRDLARTMVDAHRMTPEARAFKAAAGHRVLSERYTWAAVAGRLTASVDRWVQSKETQHPYIAWITPWNSAGRIAAYSAGLIEYLPLQATIFAPINDARIGHDDPRVARCWTKNVDGGGLSTLGEHLDLEAPDAVVIQLEPGLFDAAELEQFVRDQKASDRTVLIDFHSAPSETELPPGLVTVFDMCDRLMVHTYQDLNRAKAEGILHNVVLLPDIVDPPMLSATGENMALGEAAPEWRARTGYERLSARIAGLIEALHRDRHDDGAATDQTTGYPPPYPDSDSRQGELSEKEIQMGPTEQAALDHAFDKPSGQDLRRLRQQREDMQTSLRASLQKIRMLEGQLAAARTVQAVTPDLHSAPAPIEDVIVAAPPPPQATPARPPSPGLRRRLAFFAYRLVRPVIRPALWRLRGFIAAGVWETGPHAWRSSIGSQVGQTAETLARAAATLDAVNGRLVDIQQAIAAVNLKLDQEKAADTEMKRLSQEMEKTLLSLAIGANGALAAPSRPFLEN